MKCRKDTKNIDPKVVRTKNDRLIMKSKCSVFVVKKSRFVKEQEAKSFLSNLEIKIRLSKIPLLNVLSVKVNEIVNKLLLVEETFMPAMHLKQPRFTYIACGPFTKSKERIKRLCKLELQTLFIKMNLIKLVFNRIWLIENQKI